MSARSLVVIPGLAFSARVLMPFARQLAESTGCANVLPVEIDRITSLDAAVDAVTKHAQHGSVLLGWSLGGSIAMAAAARSPTIAGAVIAISALPKWVADASWPGIDPARVAELRTLAAGEVPRFPRRFSALVQWPHRAPELTESILGPDFRKTWLEQLELLAQIDLRKELSSLCVPTLSLFGDRDAIVPVDAYRQMAAIHSVQPGRAIELAGCGHAPFATHREQALMACEQFLAGLNS